MFEKLYQRGRWTIGFIESSAEDLFERRVSSPKIHWLKHNLSDRFWADPFIVDVEKDGSIRILVEEIIWTQNPKGTIVELLISPNYHLIERWKVLEENFHLSYPFVERVGNDIYVYPESSESGRLFKYKLVGHSLEKVGVELDVPICDATKVIVADQEFWFGTLRGHRRDSDLCAFYRPVGSCASWRPHPKNPLLKTKHQARPGGAFVFSKQKLYRCAQNSSKTYGGSLSITEVDLCTNSNYKERLCFEIHPDKQGYCPNGLHTLNSYKGVTVVDGIREDKFAPFTRLIYAALKLFNKHGKK